MGVIGKLAFWRKSSKKVTAIEPFEAPIEPFEAPALQTPKSEAAKVSSQPVLIIPVNEISVVTTPAAATDAGSTQDDEALLQKGVSSDVSSSSCHGTAPSPLPQRSRVGPTAQAVDAGLASPDADELEAELCDEVLFPLPEPKRSPEVTALSQVGLPNEQDDWTFDKPLEDIFAGVSQAFGPMIASSLQSPKWDKRSQALKAVGTMLRGLDLQGMAAPGSTGMLGKGLKMSDRVCCWRWCCQLLHHVMRDKVMPVRLASHELFQEAFGNAEGLVSQEECHFALNVLVQHSIDRLGDSNLRLHESARKCICFCAERPFLLGLHAMLARLRARLDACGKGGDRQKVHNGVLDTVNILLQHFPGCRVSSRNLDDDDDEEAADAASSWTAADIAPFVFAGMDDSLGPRVRSTVIVLAVTVYQTFGMEAMQPVLEGLRPAKQALLRQKFQESEDMEPEDFQRNTHCGTTSSTMATRSDNVTRSDSFNINDLVVCGSGVNIVGSHPTLPGSLEDPEEDLMDGILEETGMVFNGACIVNEVFGHDSRCLRPVPGLSRTLLEDELEEEHRILEEELLKIDGDEQAFRRDYVPKGVMRTEMSMEVC